MMSADVDRCVYNVHILIDLVGLSDIERMGNILNNENPYAIMATGKFQKKLWESRILETLK
jgi:hypothetical protein